MIMFTYDRKAILLDVDNLDHVTIEPKWGKPFNCEKAVRVIDKVLGIYPEIKDSPDFVSYSDMQSEAELTACIISIRTYLMKAINLA